MTMKPAEKEQEPALPVTTKVKLMLCTDNRFFGPGVCELLEKIGETGSIQAAAAKMELSYSKAWRILNQAEKEMGTTLITRISGGRRGGSSTLTEAGETAVRDFRTMEKKLTVYAEKLLNLNSRVYFVTTIDPLAETEWYPRQSTHLFAA